MTTVRKMLDSVKPLSKKREAELDAIKDEDIDYSDIPELDDSFWENATLQAPKNKKRITIRLDEDIINHFKKYGGDGYQTRMNTVLRSYVKSSVKNGSSKKEKKKKTA